MERGQRIIREHVELRGMLERLEGMREAAPIGETLRLLARMLDEHFKKEEQGGYLGFILERSPWLAVRVQVLGRQHPELRAECVALIEVAGDRARTGELIDGVARFVARLRAHEHAETEVIQDSLYDEIDGSD
ncbi:MAG TPA: hemerythrin domain-containing protein [Kofleriaceae bacterium]|nr:hemerythrin domain-containing protein [Kofleriaceae bacterium]